MKTLGFILSFGLISQLAYGQTHPCKKLELEAKAACISAGYVKNGKPGKALFKDCIHPIMQGHSVPNVQVSAADQQACQVKRAAEQQNK